MEREVRIFVSHRIDINSETVDNPIYVPVRCGAVFDSENPMNITGDDTGDNISSKRMSFCEFTVQYWAWKNAQADYCGLCHYRRFLSFSDRRFRTDDYGMVHEPYLTPGCMRRYGLTDREKAEEEICRYDAVTSEYARADRLPTPKGRQKSVREFWEAHDGVFFEKKTIGLMFELIDAMAPEYSRSAREYFDGAGHRGYNCYVMKRELFDRMCRFQFPIMFEIEKQIRTEGYTQTMMRTPAFIGEMLYGIFMYHISVRERLNVKERQLVYFVSADRINGTAGLILRSAGAGAEKALRLATDPLLPKGSRRREALKNAYYAVTGKKRRGAANIK
ncbi:MAG: DUF4422 domain-containing protein [Oscillospiraceae bacterium]|nr:DUF4422 domain-containing protein [Oscillospiraceae bacterium]